MAVVTRDYLKEPIKVQVYYAALFTTRWVESQSLLLHTGLLWLPVIFSSQHCFDLIVYTSKIHIFLTSCQGEVLITCWNWFSTVPVLNPRDAQETWER